MKRHDLNHLDREIGYEFNLHTDKLTTEMKDRILDIRILAQKRIDNGDYMPRVVHEAIVQLEELIDCEVRYKWYENKKARRQ